MVDLPPPPAAPSTPVADMRRLLHDQIVGLWNDGRLGLVRENYAEDIVDHMPVPGQLGGLDGMEQVVVAFREAMPDLRMMLHGTIVSGDLGCDFWTLTGTNTGPLFGQPPTDAAVRISGIDMIRVREGQIAELWHVEEMLQFDAQLGGLATAPAAPSPWPLRIRRADASEQRGCRAMRSHLERVRAAGDADAARMLYARDAVDLTPARGQPPGVDGIRDGLAWLRAAAPDLRLEVEQVLAEGDRVVGRWTVTGTHTAAPLFGVAASGCAFGFTGMDVARLTETGQIDRVFHVEELARLRADIGGPTGG